MLVTLVVLAVALAVLIGASLGLLGGGGSILTVPILVYVLRMEAHEAIATSLLVVGTTSLAALVPHARAGRIRWRTGVVFGLAGMLGAFVAGRVAKFIPPAVLLLLFGAMMMVTAIAMLRGHRASKGAGAAATGSVPQPTRPAAPKELPVLKVLGEGLVVGAVTGLVGAGGGFLVVPALVLLGGLSMEVAVGTSLVVIAMKSFAGFAGYLGSTSVNWKYAALVTGAAVIGSVLGARLAGAVSPDKLRRGFGWFVISMAVFILGQQVPEMLGAPEGSMLPHALGGALLTFLAGLLLGGRKTGARGTVHAGASRDAVGTVRGVDGPAARGVGRGAEVRADAAVPTSSANPSTMGSRV
jgi:uncharacterized membrane protein YfcA